MHLEERPSWGKHISVAKFIQTFLKSRPVGSTQKYIQEYQDSKWTDGQKDSHPISIMKLCLNGIEIISQAF